MDKTLNNVLEGARQYFMGVPKQTSQGEGAGSGAGQPVWPAGAPPPEEGAPAQSGAPAPCSRPPSSAAAESSPAPPPPRPPSEPLEPEPHIIHKATVMREALEKRREQPDPEDEEDASEALSPPSHIIRRPPPAMPSPAPAPAAPSPSPARPPSAPVARPPEHYRPDVGRLPDPYSATRPPEPYQRYHYDTPVPDSGRASRGPPAASPQPSVMPRHSPQQTYARISSSMPVHTAMRIRESSANSPPARYAAALAPPPPHNDRVPPIHHHHPGAAPGLPEARPAQPYARHEPSPYSRVPVHYDRHAAAAPRKYDPQQAYPGYRNPPGPPPMQSHRVEHHHVQYKQHTPVESHSAHYTTRPHDRVAGPPMSREPTRIPSRAEYSTNRPPIEARSDYQYPSPSTSSSRYPPIPAVPVVQSSTLPSRSSHSAYRPTPVPKTQYDYATASQTQTSPARPTAVKPGFASQQARMTVSVTSIVNQMNQTKQKRESPLDLSVKTVKNSADSSTTQDDHIDSAVENKPLPLQPLPSLNTRHMPLLSSSHKVDFAPDFHSQYRDRIASLNNSAVAPSVQPPPAPVRYNGTYERPSERYVAEHWHPAYTEHNKHVNSVPKNDHVPRIDLTRAEKPEVRHSENRARDDRHFIIEERKRTGGPIVNNIPEKIVRYETWSADGRIDRSSRIDRSAREQQELMSRPVYSYSSHKRFEAYQNEQKKQVPPTSYRDPHHHSNHRYPYPVEPPVRVPVEYQMHYDRHHHPGNGRHVIQKLPNHNTQRNLHHHHHPHHSLEHHNGVPADKRVLSILRNSLETKQSGFVEPPRQAKQIPDLIVIDDGDDAVIEITEEEQDTDKSKHRLPRITSPGYGAGIHLPKAVDSIAKEVEYERTVNNDAKSKSPENDVASRTRTKAELKAMPLPLDNTLENKHRDSFKEKLQPKSQKQHLFNQIRQDSLRLESVIKTEITTDIMTDVKTEPMNIEEIERDAIIPIKMENDLNIPNIQVDESQYVANDDLDWSTACDSFMEELKSGSHKKKNRRRRTETGPEIKIEIDSPKKIPEVLKDSSANDSVKVIDGSQTTLNLTTPVKKLILNPPSEKLITPAPVEKPLTPVPVEKLINSVPTKTALTENPTESSLASLTQVIVKQEPIDDYETQPLSPLSKVKANNEQVAKEKNKKKDKSIKEKISPKVKEIKKDKVFTKKLKESNKTTKETIITKIKEEIESTDDDEPLIKSKLLKEKEKSDQLKIQLLRDLSEKSAYVKLECCDVDMNTRKSLDSSMTVKEKCIQNKSKLTRQSSRSKGKSLPIDNIKTEKTKTAIASSDSESDEVIVASRLRVRKVIKSENSKEDSKHTLLKSPAKSSPAKKHENYSSCSTPLLRKPGFGDGSDFHPGWEEELYRYKRSLRMPSRLIAIPRGRSGGPFPQVSGGLFARGSTSLPDLDPAPLSPAPSSAPSAATDDLYTRRQDKITLDSDLESNSSYSAPNKLQYDSEASTSTVSSSKIKKKGLPSIVDVLIQKCSRKDESLKKKSKDKIKEDLLSKLTPTKSNTLELFSNQNLSPVKNGAKGILSTKKDKLSEELFYFGNFRKDTVTAFRDAFIRNSESLLGSPEEFPPVVLKSRNRTKSRGLKPRASIKEVFGDDRPASAPPTACREVEKEDEKLASEEEILAKIIKKEPEAKPKLKSKKIIKEKTKRRSSSIRDGLRSTSLKRNDAKGRLLRLKKRNKLNNNLTNKKVKGFKHKKDKVPTLELNEKETPPKEDGVLVPPTEETGKKRLKRLFCRRKFSSGFDYIRKKKKIIRREDGAVKKIRRQVRRPSPESAHDIHKEIKGWFINKSIGETPLHRAARLGYTDCVAYCLEKLSADPSAKDNAGFTALHVAAAKGHVRIGRLLLQYGANVSAAAQGGIRPLHEASENNHVEMIRLLLSYGADPVLGTYAGQTPGALAEGAAAALLRLHVADVQGRAREPWLFPPATLPTDQDELGCDPLASPPTASPPLPEATMEIQCTEAPLPPFYSFRSTSGQPAELWCLLQDVTSVLQIKSKESLLKQIHCGSGSPKELFQEVRTQEFLERAQCHQLLAAGEKVNVRASKVALVRVTDKLRQLLKVETVLVS